MGRYLGYIRVSTDDQKQGKRAQKDAIQATADQLRMKERTSVIWFIDDGVSGALAWEKRPALADLLLGFKRGDTLIVQRRDRLDREAIQAMMMDRMVRNMSGAIERADGARWDDSPESRLIRGILDLFSEYERNLISMRTKRALEAKRKRGEFNGGHVPYGMRLNADDASILEVDPLQWQCILKYIMEPRWSGLSYDKIARPMMSKRFRDFWPPKYGKKWGRTTLKRIFDYHTQRMKNEKERA